MYQCLLRGECGLTRPTNHLIMITLVFLITIAACSVNVHGQSNYTIDHSKTQANAGKSVLHFSDLLGQLTINIQPSENKKTLIVDLTNGLKDNQSVECTHLGAEICKRWVDQNVELTISAEKNGWRQVTWTSKNYPHENCFPLGKSNWFGGPSEKYQNWPIEKSIYSNKPVLTLGRDDQSVADPFWFNSMGVAIIVDKGVPLFIDQNSINRPNQLCLKANIDKNNYRDRDLIILSYMIGYHSNARDAYLHSVQDILGKPSGVPNAAMVRYPIWSTSVIFQKDINEKKIRDLAKNITDYGFQNSHLEIDERWETCYGNLQFDKSRFPNIQNLVRDLNRDQIQVSLWTHPFVNTACTAMHSELLRKGWFVKNDKGTTTTKWWNGDASVIDFTNWDAGRDWEDRLKKLKEETGIASFKFVGGQSDYLPTIPNLAVAKNPLEDYPSHYTTEYLRAAAKFGSLVEVATTHLTQDLPVFVRMTSKNSTWDANNGIKSLVKSLLQMTMVGYPFVLPDMIGGNQKPSKELFIRWLQATTFMPAMQFSRAPWEYDDETINIAHKYTGLHSEYADTIIELMTNSSVDGSPVNTPIWWLDPTDKVALEVDSEYMLGEDILVAPILDEKQLRDIYLPQGRWLDKSSSKEAIYEGKQWLYNYPAPLNTLPWFTRVKKSSSPSDQPATDGSPRSSSSYTIMITTVSLLFLLFRNQL